MSSCISSCVSLTLCGPSTLRTPTPFNAFSSQDLEWSFWNTILIIILSYLKFPNVYTFPSKHIWKICPFLSVTVAPFPDIYSLTSVPRLCGSSTPRRNTRTLVWSYVLQILLLQVLAELQRLIFQLRRLARSIPTPFSGVCVFGFLTLQLIKFFPLTLTTQNLFISEQYWPVRPQSLLETPSANHHFRPTQSDCVLTRSRMIHIHIDVWETPLHNQMGPSIFLTMQQRCEAESRSRQNSQACSL